MHLDVLGPAVAAHGTRSDPNNSSLVLRAQVGGVRMLLPGDAEVEAQRELLDAGADLRADVLKVPHHGSAYSDPRFLAAVHARSAVISVGLHNDYGHPSPLLLAELARLGVPVLRTDRDGDVAVAAVDGRLARRARRRRQHGRPRRRAAGPPHAGRRRVAAASARRCKDGGMPRPRRSRPTTCPTRCPASSWSSATRSCSSSAPSARSPPRRAAPTRRRRGPSWPAARSRAPSCTSCSARRCSATPRLMVVRAAQDVRDRGRGGARPVPADARPRAPSLVLHHVGGAKGKAVLDAGPQGEGARDRLRPS